MATTTRESYPEKKKLIESLFERAGPILVEIRFPGMATSPDWQLIEEEEELSPILDRIASGSEVYLHNVWDLKNSKEAICVKK